MLAEETATERHTTNQYHDHESATQITAAVHRLFHIHAHHELNTAKADSLFLTSSALVKMKMAPLLHSTLQRVPTVYKHIHACFSFFYYFTRPM